MQATKILQAVILMLILAMAASCTMGKKYSSLVFAPRQPIVNDSVQQAVRFLNWGEPEDSLKENKPIVAFEKEPMKIDTVAIISRETEKIKPAQVPEPVVKTGTTGGVRTKRTRNDQ